MHTASTTWDGLHVQPLNKTLTDEETQLTHLQFFFFFSNYFSADYYNSMFINTTWVQLDGLKVPFYIFFY